MNDVYVFIYEWIDETKTSDYFTIAERGNYADNHICGRIERCPIR